MLTNAEIRDRYNDINLVQFDPDHKGTIIYLNREYGAFMADGATHDKDLNSCPKIKATYGHFKALYPYATNNSWLRTNTRVPK